jgi:uncharacterized membrane protein
VIGADAYAVASAVAFGLSDFCAGLGSRRKGFWWVTVVSLATSSTGAWILVAVRRDGIDGSALVWGALAGTGAAVGAGSLYRGLATGQMAVVAPLSAVGAAALPALVGFLLGERLALLGVLGIMLALPAIWLMSRAGSPSGLRSGTIEGLASGSGFALEFVGLARAGTGAGLWPVAVSQSTALLLLGASLVVRRPEGRGDGTWLSTAALAGLLSLAATALYFLAATRGQLTVAAVLAALYPGVTVVLAAVLLRERPGRIQLCGMVLGAVAVTLVVTS